MFHRPTALDAHAGAVLDELRRALPEARAHFDALVATIRSLRHDRSRVHDVGLALEEIARGKLYRLRGHATLHDLLSDLGVSRTTAQRWRTLARAADDGALAEHGIAAAYLRLRAASRRPGKHAPRRPRDAEAQHDRRPPGRARQRARKELELLKKAGTALAARLRRHGLRGVRVVFVTRAGRPLVQLELDAAQCAALRW